MKKRVFLDTLKKDKNLFVLLFVASAVNFAVFLMYHILIEAFLYALAVIFAFAVLLFCVDFVYNFRKAKRINYAKLSVGHGNIELPESEFFEESEYQEIIKGLIKKINAINLEYSEEKRDVDDWYTVWVHQIKTPIAVLKLKVPQSDKETLNELFRIEEYADMALSYIRLGSNENDLVIREYRLDELIKETLRKYAPLFISKKIKLSYEPTDKIVVTDKKWLLCIIEQYISNAVKYTNNGSVCVTVKDNILTVIDTGVGIKEEDLPRIFEKGYTGNNGRADAKSSGLGLYLSAKAAKLIGVKLKAESTYKKGSSFSVIFPYNQE